MQFLKFKNYIFNFFLISCVFCINGCSNMILSPDGLIAKEQRSLLMISCITMLFIIIPVIIMTIFFSIRYRESNVFKKYDPKWSHSSIIELLTWGIPIVIIIFLSVLSWKSAHNLDPSKPIIYSNVRPVKINVISLDWKWLFIYPEQRIATINKLVIPVNTPIVFKLTSNSVMNSFFIPSLGSQVYTMPGMKTNLNLIADRSGEHQGFSSNYSGKGFSDMKFNVLVTPNYMIFDRWTKEVQKLGKKLNSIYKFNQLSKLSKNNEIEYFSGLQKNLFELIVKNVLGV